MVVVVMVTEVYETREREERGDHSAGCIFIRLHLRHYKGKQNPRILRRSSASLTTNERASGLLLLWAGGRLHELALLLGQLQQHGIVKELVDAHIIAQTLHTHTDERMSIKGMAIRRKRQEVCIHESE